MPKRDSGKQPATAQRRLLTPLFWIVTWCIFTVTLVIWWIIFASHLVASLIEQNSHLIADNPTISDYFGKQNMLFWEGLTLVILLLVGGIALVYYVWRLDRQNRQIRDFFSAFTHELKTPIASLQLQAEILSEEITAPDQLRLLNRLLKDAQRLELRFDNSLYYANLDRLSVMHFESLALSALVQSVQESFQDIRLVCPQEASLYIDRTAFEAVLKNLVSNALLHAAATELQLECQPLSDNRLKIRITDNGQGFKGDPQQLAAPFVRHTRRSGSGLGLYLVNTLMRKMQGRASFSVDQNQRFVVELQLRGKIIVSSTQGQEASS